MRLIEGKRRFCSWLERPKHAPWQWPFLLASVRITAVQKYSTSANRGQHQCSTSTVQHGMCPVLVQDPHNTQTVPAQWQHCSCPGPVRYRHSTGTVLLQSHGFAATVALQYVVQDEGSESKAQQHRTGTGLRKYRFTYLCSPMTQPVQYRYSTAAHASRVRPHPLDSSRSPIVARWQPELSALSRASLHRARIISRVASRDGQPSPSS